MLFNKLPWKFLVINVFKNILPWGFIKAVSISKCKDLVSVELFKESNMTMPNFNDIYGNLHNGFQSYNTAVPPFFIYSISRGKCIMGNEEVFTRSNKTIKELTSQALNPFINARVSRIRKCMNVKGCVVNLSLSGLENNYYHFLVEFFARYYLHSISNYKPDFYIFPYKLQFQKEFINLLGIKV